MYLCTGNLLVKILHFHCRGQGLVPVQGTKIMHATVNGQKKKKKRERERLYSIGFPGGSDSKEFTCNPRDLGLIPGWEDPLEKGMASHSSILAWRIPWTEEAGGLQSMGSQRSDSAE